VPTTVLQTTTLQTTALRTTTTLQTTTPGTTAEAVPEDVLVDTIPDRVLLNTGGMSLLGFAALGLASVVAGGYMLRAGTRRRR
jgi:hypothetical protein